MTSVYNPQWERQMEVDTELFDHMARDNFQPWHTGGGCFAWCRPAENNGFVLITWESDLGMWTARESRDWSVGRYSSEGDSFGVNGCTLQQALALADTLRAPAHNQQTEVFLADYQDTKLLKREFPDFDLASLPAIPDGFECTAWHHDTCPTWHEGQTANEPKRGMLMLLVDFAEPNMREFPEAKRFGLQMYADDSSAVSLAESDDWAVIEAWVRLVRAIRKTFGLGFHPDTRGQDYVNQGGGRSLTDAEADQYNRDLDTVGRDHDVYLVGMRIWQALGLLERNQ